MSKSNDCWCTFKFHFPGEKKRHLQAQEDARAILQTIKEVNARGRSSNP